MGASPHRRRILVITLVVCLLLLFLPLATLNAFRLNFLNPSSPVQALVFTGLTVVTFLLFVGVLVLLGRNVLKLYAEQRSRILGTRLRTRMLSGAVLVSLVPLVFMYAFSYLLMNRALDRWFSQPVTEMREDANRMGFELYRYASTNAHSEADSIAVQLAEKNLGARQKFTPADLSTAASILHHHTVTLQGGFAILFRDGHAFLSVHLPASSSSAELKSVEPSETSTDETPDATSEQAPKASRSNVTAVAPGPVELAILQAAQRNDTPLYSLNGTDYTLATAPLNQDGIVLVGLPIPSGIAATSARLRNESDAYWVLYRERREVRNLYMTLLLLMTALALFACCWLALNLSKQVTRPVESLADAMEAIAAGDYAHRVGDSATEELGELVASFNTMASDLESAHTIAERSTTQLSDLNQALQARRTELETIIETIPSGVVTLSSDRHIVLANRAFSEMLDPGGQKRFIGLTLDAVLPSSIVDALDHLLRRAHRMGSASAEMEMHSPVGLLHLSATVAILEAGIPALGQNYRDQNDRDHLGYVLVLEDATELLRAQKQSAWKEVARRVAHEIKNPLTPISLNAELITRHIGRLSTLLSDSPSKPTPPPSSSAPPPSSHRQSNHALAGRPVLRPRRVPHRSAPPSRHQRHRRKLPRPLRRPPRQHPRHPVPCTQPPPRPGRPRRPQACPLQPHRQRR